MTIEMVPADFHERLAGERLPDHHRYDEQRQDSQRDQTKLEVHDKQRDDDPDQAEQFAKCHDHESGELLELSHVALDAGHHAANLCLVVERYRLLLDVMEYVASQVIENALTDLLHEELHCEVHAPVQGGNGDEQDEHISQAGQILRSR